MDRRGIIYALVIATSVSTLTREPRSKEGDIDVIQHISKELKDCYLKHDFTLNKTYHCVISKDQFHHEVRDGITYGCHSNIDPNDSMKVIYYVTDDLGYHVVKFGTEMDLFPRIPEDEHRQIGDALVSNKTHVMITLVLQKVEFPIKCPIPRDYVPGTLTDEFITTTTVKGQK